VKRNVVATTGTETVSFELLRGITTAKQKTPLHKEVVFSVLASKEFCLRAVVIDGAMSLCDRRGGVESTYQNWSEANNYD
jgi:hypothetical protein